MAVIHAFALTPASMPGESGEARCESMEEGEPTEAGGREKALADVANRPEGYE